MQSHTGIRKNRKALLSDLSSFVQTTKEFETSVRAMPLDEGVEYDMNEVIMKAFKVVTRAVKFVDVWEDHLQTIDASASQTHVPPTPPADHTEFGNAVDLDNLTSPTTSHNPSVFSDHVDARRESTEHIASRTRYSRASQAFVRPGSSNSCRLSCRPLSKQGASDLTLGRVSCQIHPGSQDLASDKLTLLHNNFLTLLGYFIGLHLQSRSSSELLLTTKESVLACKDMLELITLIWNYDQKRSQVLGDARDNMYRRIGELAEAAHSIFRPLQGASDDDIVLPSEGRPLMEAATSCVRAAGEAVSESRLVIERIGDFAFEPLGLGISDIGNTHSASSIEVASNNAVEDSSSSVPLQPSKKPPPPPTESSKHLPIASEMLAPEDHQDDSIAPNRESVNDLLPPLPAFVDGHLSISPEEFGSSSQHSAETSSLRSGRLRTGSVAVSTTGESSIYLGSVRDSKASAVSQSSTRATSPDATCTSIPSNSPLVQEHTNGQAPCSDNESLEHCIMERTFAHELVYNREGQITGGTLPALIERLTTPDTTPDASFVSTFFLTFRLFATPTEFAQALIDRFQYVADSPRVAGPVRLRVYNVFKGWLESHWRNDCDKPALELIVPFATRQLQIVLPTAGKQLARLTEQVTDATAPLVPRLVSSMGKTNTSIAQYIAPDTPVAPAIISKSQMTALKNWKHGGREISIMDFDPLELARQFTLKESQIFCSILPEELLASEWTKKTGSMAVNVRGMSRLSTDLANLVADSILQVEDPKKRATIIKQWIKIANRFFELANYHSLMAIVCSLSQSTITRLKKTWEVVSTKTKSTLEHLKTVVSHDRNYAALRQRLQNHVPPCVPFVGLYLTDLTFVDAGNQPTRQLPGPSPSEESRSVINFDKHVKTAKIISELQRFQIPYRFVEIPELQTWMQDQLVRVRTTDQSDVVRDYYRRSLLLEPREQQQQQQQQTQSKPSPELAAGVADNKPSPDKFGVFSTLGWTHHSRDKMALTSS